MKNLQEIKAILVQVKSLVKEKYQISELGIFGDYVRGEVKENSQVNILIDYTEPPSLLDLVDMEYYLSDLLKVKADVISKNGLKGKRRERILSEVIYV
jgi:predicted nucleotidyltransferase